MQVAPHKVQRQLGTWVKIFGKSGDIVYSVTYISRILKKKPAKSNPGEMGEARDPGFVSEPST